MTPAFWLDVVKTLIGAFVGAGFAFGVNLLLQHQQRRRENKAAGNLASFILSMHFNTLQLLQREMGPYRDFPARMPPLEHVLPPLTTIDVKSLSFLIEAGEGQLIGEVNVAEDVFRGALDALRTRTRLHIDEVQPMFERAGFAPGQSIDIEAVQKALGPRLYGTLCTSSEQVVTFVDMAARQIYKAGQRLNRALHKEFPRAKVIIGFGPGNADDAKSLAHATEAASKRKDATGAAGRAPDGG